MKIFELVQKDQAHSSWAIHDKVKALPKRQRNPELPSVIHRFFGPDTGGEMVMKQEYQSLPCKICGRYDDDPIFAIGFSDPVSIRIKGDFATTQDRVFAISEKFLDVIRKGKVQGYETKPLGKSSWHAFRVTERVDCDESVMSLLGPVCPDCGRPDRTPGAFQRMNQLTLPRNSNTFFTTKKGWAKPFSNRYIFLTDDVMNILKSGGISGGWCSRLWTDDEICTAKEKAEKGIKWKPSGLILPLSGPAKKPSR